MRYVWACVCIVAPRAAGGRRGVPVSTSTATALQLDLFGLGPAEIEVIGAAAALMFDTNRIKSLLRESGVKNAFTGGA